MSSFACLCSSVPPFYLPTVSCLLLSVFPVCLPCSPAPNQQSAQVPGCVVNEFVIFLTSVPQQSVDVYMLQYYLAPCVPHAIVILSLSSVSFAAASAFCFISNKVYFIFWSFKSVHILGLNIPTATVNTTFNCFTTSLTIMDRVAACWVIELSTHFLWVTVC